jgi:hypothetical protein
VTTAISKKIKDAVKAAAASTASDKRNADSHRQPSE